MRKTPIEWKGVDWLLYLQHMEAQRKGREAGPQRAWPE